MMTSVISRRRGVLNSLTLSFLMSPRGCGADQTTSDTSEMSWPELFCTVIVVLYIFQNWNRGGTLSRFAQTKSTNNAKIRYSLFIDAPFRQTAAQHCRLHSIQRHQTGSTLSGIEGSRFSVPAHMGIQFAGLVDQRL